VVFLVPITAYCLILATINRRLHPVMVSGPWDAAGMLFAGSGGLLFVGPALIVELYRRSVTDVSVPGAAARSFLEIYAPWWRIWLVYYVVVIAGCIALLWLRRGKTVVYNVAPMDFERALGQLLDRLGLEWNRLGNRVFVAVGREAVRPEAMRYEHAYAAEPLAAVELTGALAPPRPPGEAVLDMEPFEGMCHITLHWRRHSGLVRDELEAELARALAQVPAPEHATGGWLMGLAAFLLALIFMGIFFTVFGAYFQGRH